MKNKTVSPTQAPQAQPEAGKLTESQMAAIPHVTGEDHLRGAQNPKVRNNFV